MKYSVREYLNWSAEPFHCVFRCGLIWEPARRKWQRPPHSAWMIWPGTKCASIARMPISPSPSTDYTHPSKYPFNPVFLFSLSSSSSSSSAAAASPLIYSCLLAFFSISLILHFLPDVQGS